MPSLEALVAAGLHPTVFTFSPRPAGRGSALTPTQVAVAADRLGLPLVQGPSVASGAGLAELRSVEPEILVVVAYGERLPAEVLTLAPHGAINLHFSLLPRHRGATPVRAALLAADAETGVSTMQLDEGMDTGPILMQAPEAIRDDDDAGSLGDRLAQLGAGALVETVRAIAAGTATPKPQDDEEATYAPKIDRSDRVIDWSRDAAEIVGRVRAMAPDPGAATRFRGHVLKVLRAVVEPGSATEPAGSVVAVGADGFVVAAGSGCVRALEVGPAGRKRMSAADFVRGYAPRLGERFD